MTEPIDLAVLVALHEEFDHVVGTLPSGYRAVEDADICVTYYRFEIPDIAEKIKWRVLVVPAGAMGPTRAAAITAHVYAKFRPENIAVLGISGSLDRNLLLGDVLIPKTVTNYLAVGAASPDAQGSGWHIATSGNAYRPSSRLMNRLSTFKHIYKHQWENWKHDTASLVEETLGDLLPEAIEAGVTRRDAAVVSEEANLASGELVGKSEHFVRWLKDKDRKFAAIDMESSGVFDIGDLTDNSGPRFIAVRGISDFADERKDRVEQKYKGAFRQIAIENAATFLWAAVQANLLAKQPLENGGVVVADKPRLLPSYWEQLDSTAIVFQHRLKTKVVLSDLFVYPDMMAIGARGERALEKSNTATLSDPGNLPKRTLLIGESQSGKSARPRNVDRRGGPPPRARRREAAHRFDADA